MSRNFIVKQYPSVRAVAHQMVLRAPSGLSAKVLWELVGYTNYNTMMSELSAQDKHKLGADMLLPLMDVCDSNAPVEFLAEERGGVFVKLSPVQTPTKSMTIQLASTVKECGEAAASGAAHIISGKVTKAQFAAFKKENREAIAALLALEFMMEQASEEGE